MASFSTILRDAPFGQLVRLATGSRFLRYPEEEPGFQLPWEAAQLQEKAAATGGADTPVQRQESMATGTRGITEDPEKPAEADASADAEALRTVPTARSAVSHTSRLTTTRTNLTREQTRPYTQERLEAEQEEAIDRAASAVIIPTRTADGITLIDWYTTDDPANPQNWSSLRKSGAVAIIFIYTFVAYASSAIYTSSEQGLIKRFNINITEAALGLSLYVIGYGTGPLLFSPISEIPAIGRNWPYIVSFGVFVILAVPTALSDSYAGLMVLRFITGYMSSPALATGGASMGDLYNIFKLPYALTAWTAAAFCAPAFGPLLSGFAVMNEGWRWSFWIILWMSSPVFLIMFFLLPETSASTILLQRAQRLRKLTGNPNLKSQSEIDQAGMSFSHTVVEALLRPMQIAIQDPGVFFTNVYTSCIYGIYYSFFEVFPLVYVNIYGFNLGELGLPFLTICVGCGIGVIIYCSYVYYFVEPKIKKHGLGPQEDRLIPALLSSLLLPAALFWFAWTSEKSIHWIVPTIGLTLFPIGAFVLFQCIFIYLPLTYPQYAASLFAANDLCRSSLAAGSILYAHPLFTNLGVGRGVSLLAGLLCGGVIGIWLLYYFGASLRARSKFALK